MELKEEKILAGIGAILTLFFIIPVIGSLISLVGLILIAISLYKMSKKLNEKNIFSNYLISIIFFILSGITFVALAIFTAIKVNLKNFENFNFFNFQNGFYDGERFFRRPHPFQGFKNLPDLKGIFQALHGKIWIIILVLVLIWILFILGGIFKKKSFDTLSNKIKVDNFKLSGLLVLLGTILTPLFGIGFILIIIGIIFEIISFFSIPEKIENIL